MADRLDTDVGHDAVVDQTGVEVEERDREHDEDRAHPDRVRDRVAHDPRGLMPPEAVLTRRLHLEDAQRLDARAEHGEDRRQDDHRRDRGEEHHRDTGVRERP